MRLVIGQDSGGSCQMGTQLAGVGGLSVSNDWGESECCQFPWPSELCWLLLPSSRCKEAIMVGLMGAGGCNNMPNQSYWQFLFQLLLWQIVSLPKFNPSISGVCVCVCGWRVGWGGWDWLWQYATLLESIEWWRPGEKLGFALTNVIFI
jgi:hypothetical protein